MKKFTKFAILLIVFTIAVSLANAQQTYLTVKGKVVSTETGAPIAGHTMYAGLDSIFLPYYKEAITDANGIYTMQLPFMGAPMPLLIKVVTYDCKGMLVTGTGTIDPSAIAVTINFSICSNPPIGCVAAFKYLMASNSLLAINFLNASYGTPDSTKMNYFWDFGDNTSSTEQNPIHIYAKSGQYNVCLIISSSDSLCHSKFCMPVDVGSPLPGPCQNTFWYYQDSIGAGYVFEGSLINGQALTWKWDFGDGTSAEGQMVTHVFSNAGTSHTVCLTTTGANADGSTCTSTSCQVVSIIIPSPCESSFSYQQDSAGTAYTFQGWSKNNQITSWKWDFGDGTTATGQSVTHSFSSPDMLHKVCLITTAEAIDSILCTFTSCQDVFVTTPSPCESSFSYQSDSTTNGYTFIGWSKNSQITSWIWDFGDGTTATGQKVTHHFDGAKTSYTVCLTTTGGADANGAVCTYKSCQDVYLNTPSPCQNYFKIFTSDNFTYSFSGNVNSGAPAAYYWDFGDGTQDTGQMVTHTFGKIYTNFNVCLTTIVSIPGTTGFDQCKSISCQTVYNIVDSSMCKAIFSVTPINATGTAYQFTNLSQGNPSYIHWDFGDNSQSIEPNPTHTYTKPGIYIACLTISDSLKNCKNLSCQEIWVNMIQPGCKASFYVIPSDSTVNTSSAGFMFINTSTKGYTGQKWTFGDGSESKDINPMHTYATAGVYNACLTIWDSAGKCQDMYCMNIYAGKLIGDHTVAGVVLAGNLPADKGTVWLISPDNNYYAETKIDSAGTYMFNGVPLGSYYIYAMLTPGSTMFFDYMPTYYPSSISWQGATLVTIADYTGWYSISLVPAVYNSLGVAGINGNVDWTDVTGAPISPATNIAIVLYNSAGQPVAYTFSQPDGTYQFNNLAYGEYTLRAEMAGKNTQTVVINLSQDSAVTNINFAVNREAINLLGVDSFKKPALNAGNPYPNPVVDMLNLDLNAAASGKADIEIIDMQGRILHRETIGMAGGNNRISIATGYLTKGVYLLRINSGTNVPVVRTFIK